MGDGNTELDEGGLDADDNHPTGRTEGLDVLLAEKAGTISDHPGLAGGDPDLASRSVVGVTWTGDHDVGGSGELGLLRPPSFLDSHNVETGLFGIHLELGHAPSGHGALRRLGRGFGRRVER
eukprot:7244101-Alexandrium_andersonii.AAC.1